MDLNQVIGELEMLRNHLETGESPDIHNRNLLLCLAWHTSVQKPACRGLVNIQEFCKPGYGYLLPQTLANISNQVTVASRKPVVKHLAPRHWVGGTEEGDSCTGPAT